MPKEGDFINCPNKNCNGQASWVCLGEPEGDFYKCEKCDGEFDENWNDLSEEKMEKSAFEGIKESIIESIKFAKTLTDLKERVENILEEYDLEEEDKTEP